VTRVLLVDDDSRLLRALRINLTARGYHVLTATDGRSALGAAAAEQPDVIVLDLGLPDLDGVEVLTALRAFSSVPVIVLSARIDSTDKVRALDRGADDYVTKPFGVDELTARLRAAVRRATGGTGVDQPVEAGDLTIDLAGRTVRRDGEIVHLTPTEWGILELLVRHHGRLVSRRQLLERVWGPHERRETSYLRVYLAQLRRKLERDPGHPEHLITEAGMGYRFQTGPASDRATGIPPPGTG
jgi:two-component system KDP operon response regulator KdpE